MTEEQSPAEIMHLSKLIKDATNGGKITGFEALAVLNYIDPISPQQDYTIALVSHLADSAGLNLRTAKRLVSGLETNVKLDGLKMVIPARKTSFQGQGA